MPDSDTMVTGSRSTLDPTQRTLESTQRELAHLEIRLLDRLEGLEKAQEKFEGSITRVPTEVDRAIKQLRELLESRIDANARLAEAQAKASETAISKTERSVEDRLREMATLFRSETGGLDEKIQSNGRRLDVFESRSAGSVDARTAAQDTLKLWIAVVGVVLTMSVAFTGVVTFLNRSDAEPGVRYLDRQAGPSTVIERPNQVVVPEGGR